MTPVVYWMVWTYAALTLGWWVGRHWDCVRACSRWCVSDAAVDRGLREYMERRGWRDAGDGLVSRLSVRVDGQRARDVLAQADDVQREAQR